MQLHPAVRALRDDPVPQRLAQAHIEAVKRDWFAQEQVGALLADLADYDGGAPLAKLGALSPLMRDPGCARELAASFQVAFAGALRDFPLAQVPFRHQCGGDMAVLQVMRHKQAAISLILYQAGARVPPATACFDGGERYELCIGGGAEVRLLRLAEDQGPPVRLIASACRLETGTRLALNNRRECKIVDEVAPGGMVLLRLSRPDALSEPTCEYRLDDGALVHQSAASREESHAELAMAVLGAMGRPDAVPLLRERAATGAPHLRWQALRHLLALDTGRGFTLLRDIAANPADALGRPAAALAGSLVDRFPQLASVETQSCRA